MTKLQNLAQLTKETSLRQYAYGPTKVPKKSIPNLKSITATLELKAISCKINSFRYHQYLRAQMMKILWWLIKKKEEKRLQLLKSKIYLLLHREVKQAYNLESTLGLRMILQLKPHKVDFWLLHPLMPVLIKFTSTSTKWYQLLLNLKGKIKSRMHGL